MAWDRLRKTDRSELMPSFVAYGIIVSRDFVKHLATWMKFSFTSKQKSFYINISLSGFI